MSIIGFCKERGSARTDGGKKLGRMARNEWRFENDGDAGEVAGSKVMSLGGPAECFGETIEGNASNSLEERANGRYWHKERLIQHQWWQPQVCPQGWDHRYPTCDGV